MNRQVLDSYRRTDLSGLEIHQILTERSKTGRQRWLDFVLRKPVEPSQLQQQFMA
jgi:hypothetical protein